jgi:hypothetical protein
MSSPLSVYCEHYRKYGLVQLEIVFQDYFGFGFFWQGIFPSFHRGGSWLVAFRLQC